MAKYLFVILLAVVLTACSSTNIERQSGAISSGPDTSKMNPKALDAFIRGNILDMKEEYASAILEYQEALEYDKRAGIYYSLGKDYSLLGKYSLAMANTREAVRLDSNNTEYLGLLANIYASAKLNDSAAIVYEKIIKTDSSNVNAYFNLGFIYEQELPLRALTIYEKLLSITGPEWNILVRVAELNERIGNLKGAIKATSQLVELDPSNTELKKILIEYLLKEKEYDNALEQLNEELELYPNDSALLEMKAQCYLQLKQWQKSAEIYAKIMEDKTIPLDSKLKIGSAYLNEAGKDSTLLSSAKSIFESIDRDTLAWQVKAMLGEIALKEKKDSLGLIYFDQAVSLASWNVDLWIRLGGLFFDRREYSKAIEFLEKALESFPDDKTINLLLGLSNSQLNNHASAKTYLRKTVAVDPKDVIALSVLGYTLHQLQESEEAVKTIEEALKISPGNVELMGTLGLIFNSMKKFSQSDSVYAEALKIDSTNALILNNYAYSLSERNTELAIALDMAKKAVGKDPENPSYLDTIGWVYYQLGDYPKAEENLEKALKFDDKNATLYDHLGDVKFMLNNRQEAMKNWKKAFELDPAKNEIKQKIEKGEL